jgi:hypothetical protein
LKNPNKNSEWSLQFSRYGLSYPEFRPTKLNPKPEQFYEAFFRFSSYWQKHIGDMSPLTLPDSSWTNMVKYAFVKELMVRPFGVCKFDNVTLQRSHGSFPILQTPNTEQLTVIIMAQSTTAFKTSLPVPSQQILSGDGSTSQKP